MSVDQPQPEPGQPAATTRYSQAEIDQAIAAISQGERLREAQNFVAASAPSLRGVLAAAFDEGGWFDGAHAQAVREALAHEQESERLRAIRSLFDQEVQLGMLVGVAVGLELAGELNYHGKAVKSDDEEGD